MLRFALHFVGCILRHASFTARRAAFCQPSRLPLTAFRAKTVRILIFLSSYLLVFSLLYFFPLLHLFFHLVLFFALLYHSRVLKQELFYEIL